MASKQLLRRLPLLSRERLNQLNPGAFPDVANDVLPIVAGSTDASTSPRPTPQSTLSPVAGPKTVLKPGALPQTLGKWTQRLSHLQTLQKPLSTLGISTPATDAARPVWPALADSSSKQQPSPTDIAAATLPSIAGLLKHKLPVSTAAAISFESKAAAGEVTASGAAAGEGRPSAASDASPSPVSADGVLAASISVSTDDSPAAGATALTAAAPTAEQPQHPPQALPQQPQHQRRSSGGRANSAASSSIQLNKHIMACRTTEELLALVQHRGAHFDYFNISTALARVPKLAASGPSSPGPYHHALSAAGAVLPPPPPPPAGSMSSGSGGACSASFMSPHGGLPSDLHLDAAGRSLLDHLAQLMVTQINSFDARGLANSAWAFGKLKYVPSGGLPSVIAAAALRRMHEFSPQNLSNLVWSFVYMHHADEVLLAAASRFVRARVSEFKPQELANIVWAFASLGHRDDQMLHVVAHQAQRIAPLFKEQELSNVLWALGKMSLRGHPEVFEALMAETRAKLPAFLPQGISNVAWALASVGHADTLFLDQVVAQCSHQLAAFDVQALANLVWAMASLGYYQAPFIGAVVNECLGRGLDRLSPQNLSNILWGCATLNHRDPRMLSAWANQTLEKLPSFEPQGISNTAWAFARLGFHSPQLFQALSAAALHKMDGFTAQGLSNLAWALATAGHAQPGLFEAMARQAAALAPSFNSQNCSVTLWACATLRHYDDRLFDVMLERLVSEVEACEPQNVANALWAVARMGHPLSPENSGELVRHAMRLLPRMSQQELCNTMWAVACLELMNDDLFAAFCDCLQRLADISPEGMHQAYHAQLMFHSSLARAARVPLLQLQQLAESNLPSSRALLPRLPEPLHSVAASMWAASARDVHVSRLQQEVSGALAVAGVPHAVEWMTDDQHFSVDIGLQVNSQPTAVEVNGSHHYASNAPHRALGDMAVRRRLLEDRGWHVVDVGFADWEAMGHTLAERGSNLVGRMAATLDDWDWRFVGLPMRSVAGANAPAPQAVVMPTAAPQAAAAAATATAPAVPLLQDALAAAMGLGPLYSAAALQRQQAQTPAPQQPRAQADPRFLAGMAASTSSAFTPGAGWPALSGLGGFGLGLDLGLGLGLGLGQLNGLATGGQQAVSSGAGLQRAGSLGLGLGLTDEQTVQAAVEAAEALCALPGGNLLLAKQMYDVLGVQLPPPGVMRGAGTAAAAAGGVVGVCSSSRGPAMADVLEQMVALQQEFGAGCGSGGSRGSPSSGVGSAVASCDEEGVSDDDLERVVQFALA